MLIAALLVATPLCAAAAGLVNINTADLATLETLNGIGPSKAQAIIDYRTHHGAFAVIADIQNVSGIGTATYNNIKDFITVSDTQQQSSQTQATTTQTQIQTVTQTASQQSAASQAPTPSYVAPPVPELFVDAGDDRRVIVAADNEFHARAYDRNKVVLEPSHTRFSWNFGDGSTTEGQSVLHRFAYPGRYLVVVTIAHDVSAAADRFVATAEPARLSFAALSDGGVAIGNRAGRDLDLSHWLVRSAYQSFALPSDSVVLTGETLRIPKATLGFFAGAEVELDYPNGMRAAASGETVGDAPVGAPTTPVSRAPSQNLTTPVRSPAPERATAFSDEADVSDEADIDTDIATVSDATTSVQVAAASAFGGGAWWLGALGLTLLAGGSVVAARRFGKNEWNIVEEGGRE